MRFGDRPELYVPLVIALFVFLAKSILVMVALVFGRLRRQKRRLGFTFPSVRVMRGAFALCMVGLVLDRALGVPGAWVATIVGAVAYVAAFVPWLRASRFRKRIHALVLRHDWDGAIAAAEAAPTRLERDPLIAHDVALCRAIRGERARAVDALRALADRWPRVLVAHYTRAVVRMSADPAAALQDAREFQGRAPRDPGGPLLAARALVKLGRLDEAERAARAGLALEPLQATTDCVLAEVALARGDQERAAEACRRAFDKAPGDAEVRLTRARLAVAAEGREQARRLVAEALEAAEASPFSFLVEEARLLAAELDARFDDPGAG